MDKCWEFNCANKVVKSMDIIIGVKVDEIEFEEKNQLGRRTAHYCEKHYSDKLKTLDKDNEDAINYNKNNIKFLKKMKRDSFGGLGLRFKPKVGSVLL